MNTRLLSLLLFPALALGQGNSAGGAYAKIPTHAVIAALEDVAVVKPGDIGAIGMNPANVFTHGSHTSVAFSHAEWIQGISGQRLSTSFPLPVGRLALGAAITTVAGIELRDQPGPALGTFDAKSAVLSASWGLPVSDGIVAGIAASYLYEKLYVYESTGFGLDVGALAQTPVDGLTIGASLVNAGQMSAFRRDVVDIPTTLRFGGMYRLESGSLTLEPALSIRQELHDREFGVAAGATALYQNLVGVRFSWRSGETARSLGFGLMSAYGGLGLEYSLVPISSGLGTAHMITVLAHF